MAGASNTAQWSERPAVAAVAYRGRWVQDANGRYELALTGTADAFWTADVDGRYRIDPAATSGAELLVIGGGRIAL